VFLFAFVTAGALAWWDVADMYRYRQASRSPRGPHEDYVVYYSAGRLVREGQGHLLYDVPTVADAEVRSMGRSVGGTGVLAYFNPPFVAAAFAPLSALPIEWATIVIGVGCTGLAVASAFALQRLLGLEDRLQRLLFWLWFLSLHSVAWGVLHGQLSFLLLLGWLSFIFFQMKGRESLSGASLALLLIKPQMAVLPLLLMLWKRRWRTLASFAAIAWCLAMVSISVSGPSAIVEYPRFLMESTGWDGKWGVTPQGMFGWSGLAARFLENGSAGHLALTLTLGGLTLLLGLLCFKGAWEPREPRFLLQCAGLLTASLLMNPHLYMQDLSLMALAVVLGIAYGLRTGQALRLWLGLALLTWVAQLWGLRLLDDGGINVLTPLLALLLVAAVFSLQERRAVAASPVEARMIGRTPEVNVLLVLQAAYVAFIVALCVIRDTFLMPDVIFLLLLLGFVWGRRRMEFVRDFAPFILLLLSYDALRGFADDLASNAHIGYPITLERLLFFGHIPTQDLQRWLSSEEVTHWYDSLAALLHAAHFVVPLLFAALIWQHRRGQYWRFITALLLLSYAGFITYLLLPTAPPWWAGNTGHLEGVGVVHLSGHTAFLYDKVSPNPVAAMPSLHAAYPWLFFLFACRLWGKRGRPVVLYPMAVFFSSVYLGHHYVVDIIAGVIYATAAYTIVCPIGDYLARNRWLPAFRLIGVRPRIRGLEPTDAEGTLAGASAKAAQEQATGQGEPV
jgi:hypothetical protein